MPGRSAPRRAAAIVSRTFTVRHRARDASTLSLHVFRPRREPTGEYRCIFELRTARRLLGRSPGIFGEDSMQALVLALGIAVMEVDRTARDLGGTVEAWQLEDLRVLAPRALVASIKRSAPRRARRR